MNATPRHFLYLICLWLSAFTVVAHAVAPVGSPIAKRSGSAFSASTHEVSLIPTRAAPAKAMRDLDTGPDRQDPSGTDVDVPAMLPSPALPAVTAGEAECTDRRAADSLAPSRPRTGFAARAPPTA